MNGTSQYDLNGGLSVTSQKRFLIGCVFLIVMLSICQVHAHDPGLSTADVFLATNGTKISVGFAASDLAPLITRSSVDALATQICALAMDGSPLVPLAGGLQPKSGSDMRFAFVFPPVTGQRVRIEFPLLRQLTAGHRQYLMIRNAQGELVTERLLQATADSVTIELRSPRVTTGPLPKFLAVNQNRMLTFFERLALLGAVVAWGAAHAFTPGHGKTIAAAYLVGARSTPWHAVVLGLTVTATHTLTVFLLGILTLFAAERVPAAKLYPWLAGGSGLVVLLVGATMLIHRLRGLRSRSHDFHDHHHHHHDQGHAHDQSHAEEAKWRQLLGLGVSGGLLPCPAALVLLLTSIAMQRVVFGLVLVLAFSVGLAVVLTLIGLLVVKGGRVLDRWPTFQRFGHVLPVVSALLIVLLGIGLCVQAFSSGLAK